MLTLLAAPRADGAPRETLPSVVEALGQGGITAQAGHAKVNGETFPAYAVQSVGQTLAASVAALTEALQSGGKRRFAVTQHTSEHGVVLIAWDMQSPACPTCTPASPERLQEVFDGATVMTVLPLPSGGTLAIASSAGALRRAELGKGSYEGTIAKSLLTSWRIDSQSSFHFGRAAQHSHTARSSLPRAQAEARLKRSIEQEGYVQMAGPKGEGVVAAGNEAIVFVKEATVVSYLIETDGERGTVVRLFETTAP